MSEETSLSRLDSIAQEIRVKEDRCAMDMIDIGASLIEAKRLVKHGEWKSWLEQNTDISERSAQVMMQACERFQQNPSLQGIGWSKLVPLMSLPSGEEDKFIAEHDLQSMSVREMRKAVKEYTEDNTAARQKPVDTAQETSTEQGDAILKEIESLKAELKAANESNEQIRGQLQAVFDEKRQAEQKNIDLETDKQMLQDQIDSMNAVHPQIQTEAPSGFSLDAWVGCASDIMTRFAKLPYSIDTFAAMKYDEKKAFCEKTEELLRFLNRVMKVSESEALAM